LAAEKRRVKKLGRRPAIPAAPCALTLCASVSEFAIQSQKNNRRSFGGAGRKNAARSAQDDSSF
jgi:hypothetical protein